MPSQYITWFQITIKPWLKSSKVDDLENNVTKPTGTSLPSLPFFAFRTHDQHPVAMEEKPIVEGDTHLV